MDELRRPGPRRPGLVPDVAFPAGPDAAPIDVTGGVDSDGDGHADTLVTDDGIDLVIHTDLDGDGLADQVLRIGPDGAVREMAPRPRPVPGALAGMWDGVDAGEMG